MQATTQNLMGKSWALLALGVILLRALTAQASAELQNASFHYGDMAGWEIFGEGWRLGEGDDAHRGSYGAVNDVLTSDTIPFRGLYQDRPVVEGETITFSASVRAVNVESSESWLEIQFFDEAGEKIDHHESEHVKADQPFTRLSLKAVAPEGAQTMSFRAIVFMANQPTINDDFHIFDDFQIERLDDHD